MADSPGAHFVNARGLLLQTRTVVYRPVVVLEVMRAHRILIGLVPNAVFNTGLPVTRKRIITLEMHRPMQLHPEIQTFAESIQRFLATNIEQSNQSPLSEYLQNLDEKGCDLYVAIHAGGSAHRITNDCVSIAANAFMLAKKNGGLVT